MSNAGHEAVDRRDGTGRPAGRDRVTPPIPVVVGVVSLIAGTAWLEVLEPPIQPSITVEFQELGWLLFGVALIVGTLLGVRIAWGLTLFFGVVPGAIVLSEAVSNPSAQTVGGTILLAIALVCLLLPSTQQFEQRRVRLVLV
jgi:hypothetical protein